MAFFTGKGDKGTTKLFDSKDGVRVTKSAPIFECLGQLDELNTIVGWIRAASPANFDVLGTAADRVLTDVQNDLFTIQAEVAGAGKSVPQQTVDELSNLIHRIEDSLPKVTTFLIPGGTEFSSRLDIARAISRRAERRLVTLHESGDRTVSESSRAYANRLSSLFYALGRLANHHAGVTEHPPHYAS